MLTFFRKIRRSLIESDSARKYFIYALGEIALVVIGILIALQINNWNENQREQIFETKMLNEVRNQLILDTIYFRMLVERCTHVDTSAERIIEFYETNSSDGEYFEKHALNLSWGYLFEFHIGAYDALKASGLDKISNDSLRSALIELYDFWLPRTKRLLGDLRSSDLRVLKQQYEREIFDVEISVEDDGSKELNHSRFKLNQFDDPLFLDYLKMQHDKATEGIDRIGVVMRQSIQVLELLDKELGFTESF